MKSVHLVIPDLFLPQDISTQVCDGLRLPVTEKILGRGCSESIEQVPLENHLCELFGVSFQHDAPVAPISALFDGLAAGCWLRADPVHLSLQRDQMLMVGAQMSSEEATVLCASLNEYFAGQGMEYFAPHPLRWYVRLEALPQIRTTPLSQVIGGDVRRALPTGADATRWHGVFNEIQMLLHAHPLNDAREARGEAPINSVWFWGGGCDADASVEKSFDMVSSDNVLTEMFAAAADIPFAKWAGQWRVEDCGSRQLLVWTGLRSAIQHGDLAGWRDAIQDFEIHYAQPILRALRSGKIAQLQLDVWGAGNIQRVRMARGDTWTFWRRTRPLAGYSMV